MGAPTLRPTSASEHGVASLLSLLVAGIPPHNNRERSANFVDFLKKGPEGFVEVWKQQAPISPALEARVMANDSDDSSPGLNHLEAFQRSDVGLPHLRKLMAEARS